VDVERASKSSMTPLPFHPCTTAVEGVAQDRRSATPLAPTMRPMQSQSSIAVDLPTLRAAARSTPNTACNCCAREPTLMPSTLTSILA
jgi:hypothetical protein